ncbi:MAG: hypothetical protein ACHP7C_04850 [Lysobacterales bacterium]|jgi:hypothetical protein
MLEQAVASGSREQFDDAIHALKNAYNNIDYEAGLRWCAQVSTRMKETAQMPDGTLDELAQHNHVALGVLHA